MKNYATPEKCKEGKAVARLLLSALVSCPICALYFLTLKQIPNYYALMVVETLIPEFVAGLLLFGTADEVCKLCRLYDHPT